MRKFLMLTMALGALIAVSVAGIAVAGGGNGAQTVTAGNLKIKFNGGFSPTKLPKTKMVPISFTAIGDISTLDGTHAPPLKEVVLETDKNGSINVKGVAVCKAGQLQSRDTKAAEKACPKAIIGTGQTTVGVKFPEQPEIDVDSKLLVFNGGFKGGTTTLYIHAYFSAPVTGAIVSTVKIKKVHNGRYGLKTITTIPRIAGEGAVKHFNLTIKKGTHILMAKCSDGKLQAKASAKFADGTTAKATLVRTCTGT